MFLKVKVILKPPDSFSEIYSELRRIKFMCVFVIGKDNMCREKYMGKSKKISKWIMASSLLLTSLPCCADVAVIGNKSIAADSLTARQISNLWLGKSKFIPGGGKPIVVDQVSGTSVHNDFYKNVVKKNGSQLKAYWAKVVFSGKRAPPMVLMSDADVINWVASTPGGLGYIDSASVNETVKVLFRNP